MDALWTTLWVDGGGGPLTARLARRAWRTTLAVAGRGRHERLSLFGPAVLVTVVSTWVLLLWTGWVLVFSGSPGALVSTSDPAAAVGWSERIWFVAFTISTMGNGDFVPGGPIWRGVAGVATLSGFFLATLVISYLLSVVGAVVQKRAFASEVAGLGRTSEELLGNAWDGASFRSLDLPLGTLAGTLGILSEQYLSYPILQYYHAARPEKAPAVALAVLDDALTLLRFGVPEAQRPNPAVLHAARAGVATFLETLPSAFIEPAEEDPPPPDLTRLRRMGIPTVDDEAFGRALAEVRERRRTLLGLLHENGWSWKER